MTFIAPHYNKAKKNSLIRFFQRDRFFVKTPGWIKSLYPDCIWDLPKNEKVLYLSFDDGPHPTITPFVLGLLKQYNARATFFCIGENVKRYPEVYYQVIKEGHSTGNHTQHHINGWKTSDEDYLEDIREACGLINSNLFRPPYGRMRKSQIRMIRKQFAGIKIIMWNILAGDWVQDLTPEKCFERIRTRIGPGDIIVFHDSEKAFDRLEFALPRTLDYFSKEGYSFKAIPG